MKRIIAYILVLTMCLSLTSCLSNPIEGEQDTIGNMVFIVPKGWESEDTGDDSYIYFHNDKRQVVINYLKELDGTVSDDEWQDDFIDGYSSFIARDIDGAIDGAIESKYSTTIADQKAFGFHLTTDYPQVLFSDRDVIVIEYESEFYCIACSTTDTEEETKGITKNKDFDNILNGISFNDVDESISGEEAEYSSTFNISAEEFIDTLSASLDNSGEIARDYYAKSDGRNSYEYTFYPDGSSDKYRISFEEYHNKKINKKIWNIKLYFYGQYNAELYVHLSAEIFKALGTDEEEVDQILCNLNMDDGLYTPYALSDTEHMEATLRITNSEEYDLTIEPPSNKD